MHESDHGKAGFAGDGSFFRRRARLDPSQVTDYRHDLGRQRAAAAELGANPAGLMAARETAMPNMRPVKPSQVRTKRPKNG